MGQRRPAIENRPELPDRTGDILGVVGGAELAAHSEEIQLLLREHRLHQVVGRLVGDVDQNTLRSVSPSPTMS